MVQKTYMCRPSQPTAFNWVIIYVQIHPFSDMKNVWKYTVIASSKTRASEEREIIIISGNEIYNVATETIPTLIVCITVVDICVMVTIQTFASRYRYCRYVWDFCYSNANSEYIELDLYEKDWVSTSSYGKSDDIQWQLWIYFISCFLCALVHFFICIVLTVRVIC